MRIDWVHPSWRDLVIESLAEDAPTRRHFLARCGVEGAALALSGEGGATGERERPLLREDADWDALGDCLHHLCPELGEADAARLLWVLDAAGDDAEVRALSELVLKRLGWSGRTLSFDALAAWTAVASKLDSRPEPPAVTATWWELEPGRAPRGPLELDRFADWLRLAELLAEHDRELLESLGFPDRYHGVLETFAGDDPSEPVLERELRIESLDRLAALDPELALQAMEEMAALRPPPNFENLDPPPRAHFPVERVLRDLG